MNLTSLKLTVRVAGAVLAFAFGPARLAAADAVPVVAPAPLAAAQAVAVWRGEWRDPARDRVLPVKIYYPAAGRGPFPVIVFSHGLGASRETYAYLGEFWAAHGYVSVHLQHPGSDADVMTGARGPLEKLRRLRAAAADPANADNRPRDVRFALDEVARWAANPASPCRGRLDLAHVAVAGHSFGAYTVMAVVGQAIGPDGAARYYGPDPRIKAAVAMSAGVPAMKDLDRAYDRVAVPVFHLTGTRDQVGNGRWRGDEFSAIGAATPAQRRVAFDHTRHAPAYLLTFRDGDHRVFANARGRSGDGGHDAEYQRIVCIATTVFWDMTLRGDARARQWFESGGLAAMLDGSGTFEQKAPEPSARTP